MRRKIKKFNVRGKGKKLLNIEGGERGLSNTACLIYNRLCIHMCSTTCNSHDKLVLAI
jgi:hypothetical protein